MSPAAALPARAAVNLARIVSACAAALIAMALVDLRQQYQVWQAGQMLERQGSAIARGEFAAAPPLPRYAAGALPPRAEVIDALILARAAAADRFPHERVRLLAQARSTIASAMAARPDWGDAQLVSAYIGLIPSPGHPDRAVLRDFAASYRNAGFLHDAAQWRSTTGFILWPLLDQASRAHVVDEAVVIARLAPEDRQSIFAAARASPAYMDFGRVWMDTRRGDADMMPGDRPTP